MLEFLKNALLLAQEYLGMLNRQKLYNTAYSLLGIDVSPNDLAPDEYGCAETLSDVIKRAFPDLNFPVTLSTTLLFEHLEADTKNWDVAQVPQPGDVVISPTGYGSGRVPNGHCGIVGKYQIMSNDSRTGTWEANFTLDGWRRYYHDKGGYPVFFFSKK